MESQKPQKYRLRDSERLCKLKGEKRPMKRKITYLIINNSTRIGAFFIGKSARLNHSIPTEDIAFWYT